MALYVLLCRSANGLLADAALRTAWPIDTDSIIGERLEEPRHVTTIAGVDGSAEHSHGITTR